MKKSITHLSSTVQKMIIWVGMLIVSCQSKENRLADKLTANNKSQFWRVLKWNSKASEEGILLLKFYSNNEYEFFKLNTKKDKLVSLKPDSLSDIGSYEFWEVKNNKVLSFKKRVDFVFFNESNDTMKFINDGDSLVIYKYFLPATIK